MKNIEKLKDLKIFYVANVSKNVIIFIIFLLFIILWSEKWKN